MIEKFKNLDKEQKRELFRVIGWSGTSLIGGVGGANTAGVEVSIDSIVSPADNQYGILPYFNSQVIAFTGYFASHASKQPLLVENFLHFNRKNSGIIVQRAF